MADPYNIIPNPEQVLVLIGAVGALGTAAVGLVDATKALFPALSRVGFRHIENALKPFDVPMKAGVGPGEDWRSLMLAHWCNGDSKDQQKAIAKAVLLIGLSPANVPDLKIGDRIDLRALATAVGKIDRGDQLEPNDVNVFGRFNAIVEAVLDAAFERGDLSYRYTARIWAGAYAILLAIAGGWLVSGIAFSGTEFVTAVLVGLVAVPIAPITKDLISSLSAAVKAVKAAKGQ